MEKTTENFKKYIYGILKDKNGKRQNNKGITIIALIVTIVTLLILAGIAISTLLGDNGIIGKARNADAQVGLKAGKDYVEMEIFKLMREEYKKDDLYNEIGNELEEITRDIQTVDNRLTAESPYNKSKNKIKLIYNKNQTIIGVVDTERKYNMGK